jgi:signal transduction histidine kinase
MKHGTKPKRNAADLLREAEAILIASGPAPDAPAADPDSRKKIHELKVIQIELEMQREDLEGQNEELRQLREEAVRGQAKLHAVNERLVLDLMERDKAEARVRSLRKLYLALSQTNQAILRTREEQPLLQKICDIAAEFGEFTLAWIGFEAPDCQEVRVAARAGLAVGALDGAKIGTDGHSRFGRGPSAIALRQGSPVVINDYGDAPCTLPWRDRASRFGIQANAVLPITRSDRAVGVIALYSAQPQFFDQENMDLLSEIAGSLSFALDALDQEVLRKEGQARLQETTQRLNLALASARMGTYAVDLLEEQRQWDETCYRLLGVDPRRVAATFQMFMELILPEDRDLVLSHYHRALATCAYDMEYRVVWPDGSIHHLADRGMIFRDGLGRPARMIGVLWDDSERKRAELARKETEKQLEQLNGELEERVRQRTAMLENANAELDAFSYSVSHDLRAPLRGIDGFSLAVLEECGDQISDEGKHYLARVRAGIQRMGLLIDALLKLSRVSRTVLNRQRLDLSAIALDLLGELRQRHPGRNMDLRVEPGLTAIGDPGLIRAALTNLLDNAWKYTAKVPLARIGLFQEILPDGRKAFCVRDNGAGFDMEYAGKLFAAFQRLHSAQEFEGSGIGLAIVQRIIHRHGGQVWARAAVDQGASFSFTLPDPWNRSNHHELP